MSFFTWIKSLFGPSKRQQQLETVVEDLQQNNKLLYEQVTVLKQKADERDQRYQSSDPWIEIVSEDFDEAKGLRIGLDWNDAFIDYLKQHGFVGNDPQDIIRKYLAILYHDIAQRLEQEQIEKSDQRPRTSDFQ